MNSGAAIRLRRGFGGQVGRKPPIRRSADRSVLVPPCGTKAERPTSGPPVPAQQFHSEIRGGVLPGRLHPFGLARQFPSDRNRFTGFETGKTPWVSRRLTL